MPNRYIGRTVAICQKDNMDLFVPYTEGQLQKAQEELKMCVDAPRLYVQNIVTLTIGEAVQFLFHNL